MTPQLRSIIQLLNRDFCARLYTALLQYDLSVDELAELFECSEAKIKSHLEELSNAGLVTSRRTQDARRYQARSNPIEEACRRVIKQNAWDSLNHRIRDLKRHSAASLETEGVPA